MDELTVSSAAGIGDGDEFLMECEEVDVTPWSSNRDDEVEEHDEAMEAAVNPVEQEEASVTIIPIPLQPESNCSLPTDKTTLQDSGARLGFMLNGRLIPLRPGGGGAELKLLSHPRGSVSGFTTVQIPVTLTVHSPAGICRINTTASLTASITPSMAPPAETPPSQGSVADSTPIITGVVSGEAAKKVLSDHNVNFTTQPPQGMASTSPTLLKSPPPASAPPKAPFLATPPSSISSPPPRQLTKGPLGPVSPPDCSTCRSQYRIITSLRGFMCLCSPAVVQSLRNLKRKKKHHRKDRDKSKYCTQTSPRGFRTRPGFSVGHPSAERQRAFNSNKLGVMSSWPCDQTSSIQRSSGIFIPKEETVSTLTGTTSSPNQDQSKAMLCPHPQKMVILVEDFYYGSTPSRTSGNHWAARNFTGPYRCIHCTETLRNNIKLMDHMLYHASTVLEQDAHFYCPDCFRCFSSQFKLQSHLDAVHGVFKSTAACQICELAFVNEPAFLWHMKTTHKPGEMPYVCQVCDFRSSFHSDVCAHFIEAHANTNTHLCLFCLRVLRKSTCYQEHVTRHLRKQHLFGCDKCRLRFLYLKDRNEHKVLHHRTHVRPPQLSGLKPGTKVTVRTYSVVGGAAGEDANKSDSPLKVVEVDQDPPTQEVPKRKPVQSLGPLLSSLSQDRTDRHVSLSEVLNELVQSDSETEPDTAPDSGSDDDDDVISIVDRPVQQCVECLTSIRDFKGHFPSLVRCSLCRFVTCCSTAYANHMINNHASCQRNVQYQVMYRSNQRLLQTLRCLSCPFSTNKGDLMARHLADRPEHHCVLAHNVDKLLVNLQMPPNLTSVTSSGGQGGAFIPIHLLPSGQASTQLSVKPLTSPSTLSSPPAMTIKFLGPRPLSRGGVDRVTQLPSSSLSELQLSTFLYALCNGLPQAARRYRTSPLLIQAWTVQHENQLAQKRWMWDTDRIAEWVMVQREQQLTLNIETLLQTARRALGEDRHLLDCYGWAIDFMLRHDLSLQPNGTAARRHQLPRNMKGSCRGFISSLSSQIQEKNLKPCCVGAMDELSIFIDPASFATHNPSAFRLFGTPEETPLFDVILSGLSDGNFLTPVLFFRGTASDIPDGFPDNIQLEARPEGFTDEERLHIWLQKVWRPHVADPVDSPSLLIIDVHRGHLKTEFLSALSGTSTARAIIPSGCSCRLQPLEACVMPVLREFLQARWTQLLSQGGLDGLGLDQLALTLACWLSEVSSTLNAEPHMLSRSFSTVCRFLGADDWELPNKMISALNEALIQPLENPDPPPEQLKLSLEDEDEEEEEQKKQEVEEETLAESLHQVCNGESDREN